jgi:hypothetical protein
MKGKIGWAFLHQPWQKLRIIWDNISLLKIQPALIPEYHFCKCSCFFGMICIKRQYLQVLEWQLMYISANTIFSNRNCRYNHVNLMLDKIPEVSISVFEQGIIVVQKTQKKTCV